MDSSGDYQYPDRGDALTAALIRTESREDYWQASEAGALALALKALRARGGAARMLDLGCGMGRLLPVFAPLARELEGLEPDADRCARAVETAAGLEGVTVRRGDFRDAAGPYDAVLCSHVLQHIPRADCAALFSRLAAEMPAGALLILTTTHTPGDTDRFCLERFVDGVRRCETIDAARFDTGAPVGMLPVRFFAAATLETLSAERGFRCLMKYGYHFSGSGPERGPDYDRERNAAGALERARDMLYLLERN